MSANRSRKWQGKHAPKRDLSERSSSRFVGRAFFTVITLALVGLIVWYLIPQQKPQTWIAYYFSEDKLDDFSLPIPFAKEDAEDWIPMTGITNSRQIKLTAANLKSLESLDFEKNRKVDKTPEDSLIAYFVGYGTGSDQSAELIVPKTGNDDRPNTPIKVAELLQSMCKTSFGSILVVFDCSRTLNCPQWDWNETGSFPRSLENIVKSIGDDRLCVICASNANQYGISLPKDRRSVFGRRWANAWSSLISSRRVDSVKLTEFYRAITELNDPTLKTAVYVGGRGAINSVNELTGGKRPDPVVLTKGIGASTKKSTEKAEAKEEEPIPEEQLLALLQPADDKVVTLFPKFNLDWSNQISPVFDSWKHVRRMEIVLDPPKQAEGAPKPAIFTSQRLDYPEVYAPHLWRRLKAQLVADEVAAIASQKRTLENLTSALVLNPDEPDRPDMSASIVDRLKHAFAGYTKATRSKPQKESHSQEKEAQIRLAHLAYAKALFEYPEFRALKLRLETVANARQFTDNNQLQIELEEGIRRLKSFYQLAFESASVSSLEADRIEQLIKAGTELKEWQQKTSDLWAKFADGIVAEAVNGFKSKGTPPSKSLAVTLDVILSSIVWSPEQRLKWRTAQLLISQNGTSSGESITELPRKQSTPQDFPGQIVKNITAFSEPSLANTRFILKNAYDLVKERINSATPYRGSPLAHVIAAICDPRDSDGNRSDSDYAIWFSIEQRPGPKADLLSLKQKPPEKPPAKDQAAVAKVADEPIPDPLIDLDHESNQPGKFEFLVSYKPGKLKVGTESYSVKLLATTQASDEWIVAEPSQTIEFQKVDLKPGDKYEKLVSWPIRMRDNVQRKKDSPETLKLTVSFDESALKSENDRRKSKTDIEQPELLVEPESKQVDCIIKLKNSRTASLAIVTESDEGKVIGDREHEQSIQLISVPILANAAGNFRWKVSNSESSTTVNVQAKLWPVQRMSDWKSPKGRLPNTIAELRQADPTKTAPTFVTDPVGISVDKSELLVWKPFNEKAPGELNCTDGAFCRLLLDQNQIIDYWIQFIPQEPFKWVDAKPGVKLNATETGNPLLQVKFSPLGSDGQWNPSGIYSRLALERISGVLKFPDPSSGAGWTAAGPEGNRLYQTDQATLGAEFKTGNLGINNQPIHLSIGNWPRAFRWSVIANDPTADPKDESQKSQVRFTQISRIISEKEKEAAALPEGSSSCFKNPAPMKSTRENPVLFELPSVRSLNLPESNFGLEVSVEADAAAGRFLDASSPEFVIEQVFPGSSAILFRSRSDRNWQTVMRANTDDPHLLVIENALTDFAQIRLSPKIMHANCRPLEVSETTYELRARFVTRDQYSDSNREEKPSRANDEISVAFVRFDRTPPSICVQEVNPLPGSKLELKVAVRDDDSLVGNCNSAIATSRAGSNPDQLKSRVKVWVVTKTLPDVIDTKTLEMPASDQCYEGESLTIELKVEPEKAAKPMTIVVQATDAAGLVSPVHKFDYRPQIESMKKVGGSGVVRGRLLIRGKNPAKDFKVILSGPGYYKEKKTDDSGNFEFDGLIVGTQYELESQKKIDSTNYKLKKTVAADEQLKTTPYKSYDLEAVK